MAAQPAYTPPERPALYRQLPCPHCRGGYVETEPAHYCSRHKIMWNRDEFDTLMAFYDRGWNVFGWRLFRGRRFHWRTLPCGCPVTCLRIRNHAICRMCGGSGVRYHEASRSDVYAAVGATAPTRSFYRPRIPGVPTAPPMTF